MQLTKVALSFSYLLLTTAQASQQAIICFDCDDTQARQLAISNAAPQLQCNYSTEAPEITAESCHSAAQAVVVFSAGLQQSWGFQLAHSNQGNAADSMPLQVTTTAVHPGIHQLLTKAATGRLRLQEQLQALPALIVQDWQQQLLTPAAVVEPTQGTCHIQDVKAIRAAFDAKRIAHFSDILRNRLLMAEADNNHWLKQWLGSSGNATLDTVSFSLSDAEMGVSVSGSFKVNAANKQLSFTHLFHPDGSEQLVAGLQPSALQHSRIIYQFDTTSKAYLAEVNFADSMVEGLRLSQIMQSVAQVTISDCVRRELSKVQDIRQRPYDPGTGGGYEGGIDLNPGGSWNGGYGSSLCIYDVYQKGVITSTFKSGC